MRALAGDHRIQRVPVTEKNGRRHSSHVVVVILDGPDVGTDRAGLQVDMADVRIDTYRDSGPGGQHRNKTDSAVRMTHLPTGMVVTAADDRSQHRNRAVALARLTEALQDRASRNADHQTNTARRSHFADNRSWIWCGWRDEVKRPDGKSASMKRSLAGKLGPILG